MSEAENADKGRGIRETISDIGSKLQKDHGTLIEAGLRLLGLAEKEGHKEAAEIIRKNLTILGNIKNSKKSN